MRWVIWTVGSLAVIVAVVALVGAMLPQNHTASRTARIAVPPDVLFPRLVQMAQAETDPALQIERQEPPSLLVTRVVPNGAFGGTWTYRLVPAAGGTDLTITEDGEVYNVIFRFMSRFVLGHYATMDAFIRSLQAKAAMR